MKILYIDMDNVLVDFQSGIDAISDQERSSYEGRFIDAAWYDGSDKELEFDTGEASTITKATSAKVGWIHKDTTDWSKEDVLRDVLKAKNKHVKIENTATIQGLDVSKYLK